ncbi:MAG: S28 family serine protease [Kofleriaceae bacterium]
MHTLRGPASSAVVAIWLVGCGGSAGDPPLPFPDSLLAISDATVTQLPTETPGYTHYVLRFTQPVDHADPSGPTFEQRVSLIHRDPEAPLVVYTTGYDDYLIDRPSELTQLLQANQISIEHRYFGESRPDNPDWSKLTIEQMASDQHVIIDGMHGVYHAAFITTGASKGGMTAVYHRRFFPDDVDATVPYVAPMSFGAPDPRYIAFLDTLGEQSCRDGVRAVATELLANRRAMVLSSAEAETASDDVSYTRIAIGPAVESAIASLEWSFWQYFGAPWCDQVPSNSAADADLWAFLNMVSPVSDNSDEGIAPYEAYYFQAYAQLGYPDSGAPYLDPYLMYSDADYDLALPEVPIYDGGVAMHDIDDWVQNEGSELLFIYGEWDPWTGGQFELGDATDSLRLVQARGTHGARIQRLSESDRGAALDKLQAWTGVTPTTMSERRVGAEPALPRIPPVLLRSLRAHR